MTFVFEALGMPSVLGTGLKIRLQYLILPGIGALAILLFLNAIAFILSGCTLVAGVEGNKIVG